MEGVRAVRADLIDGCGWRLIQVMASPRAVSSPVLLLPIGRSVILWVHDVTVYPVILFMESDGGGSFLGEEPPPSQVR